MKKYILLLLILPFFSGCNNDDYSNNNRYLPNYNFAIEINTNLPLYNQLNFVSSPVLITQAGIGINGIIVTNIGSGYTAYEASCPNQPLDTCSRLSINGILAICPCDDVEYNLFTGLGNADVEFPLKPYRVEQLSANIIRVSN